MAVDLKLGDRLAIIRDGVKKGQTPQQAMQQYQINKDGGYNNWKNQFKQSTGVDPDQDDTYNYEQFFKENPEAAKQLLQGKVSPEILEMYKTPQAIQREKQVQQQRQKGSINSLMDYSQYEKLINDYMNKSVNVSAYGGNINMFAGGGEAMPISESASTTNKDDNEITEHERFTRTELEPKEWRSQRLPDFIELTPEELQDIKNYVLEMAYKEDTNRPFRIFNIPKEVIVKYHPELENVSMQNPGFYIYEDEYQDALKNGKKYLRLKWLRQSSKEGKLYDEWKKQRKMLYLYDTNRNYANFTDGDTLELEDNAEKNYNLLPNVVVIYDKGTQQQILPQEEPEELEIEPIRSGSVAIEPDITKIVQIEDKKLPPLTPTENTQKYIDMSGTTGEELKAFNNNPLNTEGVPGGSSFGNSADGTRIPDVFNLYGNYNYNVPYEDFSTYQPEGYQYQPWNIYNLPPSGYVDIPNWNVQQIQDNGDNDKFLNFLNMLANIPQKSDNTDQLMTLLMQPKDYFADPYAGEHYTNTTNFYDVYNNDPYTKIQRESNGTPLYKSGGKINKFETGGNTTQIEENVYSPFTINGITYGIIPNQIADTSKGQSDLEGNDVVGKPPVYVKYNSQKKKWENTTMAKDANNIRMYENRPKESGTIQAISEDGETLYGTLPDLIVGSIDNKDSLPATYDEKAKSAGAYDPYNNPSISAQLNNLFNSDPVIKEQRRRIFDARLKQYNASDFLNTIIPMHLISPTNYVGAIGEAARGNANFFQNVLSGRNRGLFSLSDDLYNWSIDHPYISTGINIIGDMALGAAVAKPFIDWRNPNSLWSQNIRTSFANDKIPFAYILKDSDNIMPYIKGTYATLKGKRIPLENRLQKAIDRSGVFDSDLFGEIPRALPNETYQQYLKRTGLPHSTEIERWYNRQGMWNQYLGVGDESHNLNMSINNRSENYIRKSDGTYDINLTKEEEANFLTPKGNSKVGDDYRYITYDYDIGNHANVGAQLAYDDGKLVSVLNDPFDLHPVQAITKHLPKSFKWLEKYIPSPEVSSILPAGAEPVTFKHIIPIEENGFTGFVWDNGQIIRPILREEAKDIINNGSFLTTDIPTITKATR